MCVLGPEAKKQTKSQPVRGPSSSEPARAAAPLRGAQGERSRRNHPSHVSLAFRDARVRPRDDARPWHAPWRALGKGVVCYANGKQIVVRSLSDDSRTVFYDGHQYPTTVARVSPNGEWVASGDASGVVRVWGLNEHQTLKAEHRVLSGAVDDIQWSPGGARVWWRAGTAAAAHSRASSCGTRGRAWVTSAALRSASCPSRSGRSDRSRSPPPPRISPSRSSRGRLSHSQARNTSTGTTPTACVFPRTGRSSRPWGATGSGWCTTAAPACHWRCVHREARSEKKNEDTNDGHAGSVHARVVARADAFCSPSARTKPPWRGTRPAFYNRRQMDPEPEPFPAEASTLCRAWR